MVEGKGRLSLTIAVCVFVLTLHRVLHCILAHMFKASREDTEERKEVIGSNRTLWRRKKGGVWWQQLLLLETPSHFEQVVVAVCDYLGDPLYSPP